MTKTIGLILFSLISTCTLASTISINVEEYLHTDMDFIFEIKNKNYKNVFVDCQGFLNNLRVDNFDDSKNILHISHEDCEYIHEEIYTNIQESNSACLKIDFERQAFGVTKKCD